MNRTILEKVWYMLAHSKLPQSFWGEALLTAGHVVNLSPCHHLEGGYPKQAWTRRPSKFEHLRVFGCRAFTHVHADERSKLDPKTWECILLGYRADEFGYKLYDPISKKGIRSRDVIFKEDQTIEDIETKPQKEMGRISLPEQEEFHDARQEWSCEEVE